MSTATVYFGPYGSKSRTNEELRAALPGYRYHGRGRWSINGQPVRKATLLKLARPVLGVSAADTATVFTVAQRIGTFVDET